MHNGGNRSGMIKIGSFFYITKTCKANRGVRV